MSDDIDSDLSFAALDALLDEALSLDDDALPAFLEALEPAQRAAVSKLLAKSRSGALDQIEEQAKEKIRDVADSIAERTAGNWQLKREIGSGGTGQVFYAERHEKDGGAAAEGYVQRAAVKVLWSHRVTSQFRDRFLRERRILASIDHPGLARFLDGGLLGDGRPWFAMEFVEGNDIVSAAADQSIEKRLELFLAVADTIEYAHRRLIVHRDIKPQNVLVDALGQPRVLDFGIARILGEFDGKDLTRAQGTPVTLQYASPEQVTGRSIDVASDVYQLGLLLFEMLTGKKPYAIDETSLEKAIESICREVAPPPGAHAGGIDKDVDAIVGRALCKEPERRYSSAAAMADDIRRFLEGRPIVARPHSTFYVVSRFVRRHAVPVAAIAASVLALTFATVFSVRMAFEAREEAERTRTTQQILADVFEQADPFGEGGANISLADALIRAKPSIDEKIADDPRLAWEVNNTLGEIFGSLDLIDLERGAYEDAWIAALELGGDNEQEILFAVAGLGNILARTDPAEAADFFAENLPPSPGSADVALDWLSAKYAEVSAHARLRDYERADAGARAMADVAERYSVDAPRTLARINQLLAGAARREGDLDSADAHWGEAVGNMRRAEVPAGLAVMLSNQALHYGMTGRYESSDAAFRESIAIFRDRAPDDTSFANVLRSYAGLQFRMRRQQEAVATLDEALSKLDPAAQGYAYFIAQLNRAEYSFASDDVEVTIDAIEQGLTAALAAFGPDSDVTQRMFAVFARFLLFAGEESDAIRLMDDGGAVSCASQEERLAVLDAVIAAAADAPATEGARQSSWSRIEVARDQAARETLDAAALQTIAAEWYSEQSVFLDVLDRRRMLSALLDTARAAGLDVPDDLRAESDRVGSLEARVRQMLAGPSGVRVDELIAALRPDADISCAN